MSRNMHLPFALLLLLITAGCTGIEKAPAEHTTRLIKPIVSDELVFEDEDIKLRFTVTRKHIDFTLWNKTQGPISVIWDEVQFRDPEGETHWVLNTQEDPHRVPTKAAHATIIHHHMDSTMVPPESSYNDYVRPFPSGFEDVLIYPFKYATGSRFKLILPLEIKEQIKIYTFGFEVMD